MSRIVRIGDKFYDFGTRNTSFLITAQELKTLGIKNYYFMLEIKHPELHVQDLDPHNPNIKPEDAGRIILECKQNPWYFFRECARVPVSGAGSVSPILLRPSAAAIWCFMNSIDFELCQPRQTYKSTWCTIILEYMFLFEYNNVNIPLLHLKLERALKSAEQLRDYICALPQYMNPWSKRNKLPGTKSLKYDEHNTSIVPLASADSDAKATDLLRGMTLYGGMFEEWEYLAHFMSILEGGSPAMISGREIAKKFGVRACMMMLSTPGDLETAEGRAAYHMIQLTPPFNEQMFDFNDNDIDNFFSGGDDTGVSKPRSLYIEYNYIQCRKSEEWLDDQHRRAEQSNKLDEYKRSVLMMRYRGTDAVLFKQEDLDYIKQHVKEPDHTIFLLKKYNLYCYNHQIDNPDLNSDTPYFDTQIPYLIGNDVAGGGDGDNTTFCIVHPYTLQVVGELTSPYIGTLDHMRLIIELVKLIPHCIFCLETNSIGKAIVDFIQESQLEARFYHDPKLDIAKAAIAKEKNESVLVKHKAQQKKYYGTYVTATARDNMIKLLIRYVKEYRHLFNTKYLVNDILNLERGKNGKVAAAQGEHDDMVMAYLHAVYILQYGTQLGRFGIDKTKCTYEKVYDELRSYNEHTAKETINNVVPYDNPESYENQLMDDRINGNYQEFSTGVDVYGYTRDDYNRSHSGIIQTQQQSQSEFLDRSDYAFFTSMN